MSIFSYCRKEVKNNDYYRYLLCLCVPRSLRNKLFALYAFNSETSKIKNTTYDNTTGLAWWLEAINGIYSGDTIKEHKVVKALAKVIKSTEIPREYFEHIIVAHEADIGIKPITNSKDFQKYIDDTSTNLLKASLRIMGVKGEEAFEAAHHIGTAYALTEQMRTMKLNAPKKHVLIPHDMLEKNSVNLYDIAAGRHLETLKPVVQKLCNQVEFHLKQADELRKSLPKKAMPIYLHSIIASIFLKRIREDNYDLFHNNLETGRLDTFIKIFFYAKFGIEPFAVEPIIHSWKYICILFSAILFVGTTVYQADKREYNAHSAALSAYQSCQSNDTTKNYSQNRSCSYKSGKRYIEAKNIEKSDHDIWTQSLIYLISAWILILIPIGIYIAIVFLL